MTTACLDWAERIVARRPLIVAKPAYPAEAAAALDVFKALHVVDVPGSPTFGEIGDEWIFDFVAAIFGAYDAASGRQLIREFFMCISKKNGKSTLAAGVMLTALIRNWRRSNEALILAPTIEAAQNSFKPAADMVRADPELNAAEGGFLHIQDHIRTITHLSTKAALKVIAADTATAVGKKAGYVLIDELWELGKKPKADAMLREATGGLISRPEGFVISITTQSDEPPAGVFKDKLEYARQVRDGEVTDTKFLPVIYEFPPAMIEAGTHLDPKNFYVTNPNIGRSVSPEWLDDQLRIEKSKGPETRNVFLAKHLNVQIGNALRADRWPGAEFWAKQASPGLTLAQILAKSDVVTCGVDGGGLDDLLGFALIGRDAKTRTWMLWGRAWAHQSVLERRKGEASKLLDFAKEGDLVIVDVMDDAFNEVVDLIEMVNEARKLASVGFDPVGVGMIVDELSRRGINQESKQVEGVSQGFKLTGTIKTAEVQLSDGKMIHAGQPLMAWCVGNAKVEMKGNAIVITKQASGSAKIDPLMAAFNAVSIMSGNPTVRNGPSVYETRGIEMV